MKNQFCTAPKEFKALGHHTLRDDCDGLYNKLVKLGEKSDRRTAIEIGTWTGFTALMLADLGFTVFAVDHFKGNETDHLGRTAKYLGSEAIFETFCSNTSSYLFRSIIPLFGTSERWAKAWLASGKQADFVYIDADHRYEHVRRDIDLWTPIVRKGGVLAGHDLDQQGVVRAVAETGSCERVGRTVWWREINV